MSEIEQANGIEKGQRVQVFNPGPMNTGVVTMPNPTPQGFVRVLFDDGQECWTKLSLLRHRGGRSPDAL